MGIILKSPRDLAAMRVAGRVAYRSIMRVREHARAGMTTADIDRLMWETFKSAGGESLSKWYPTYKRGKGFPGETCVSVNDEVVHGIPGPRVIQEGDLVTADCAFKLGGYCIDTAYTVMIGNVAPEAARMCKVSQEALELAIREIRPGLRWSHIAGKMQHLVESAGFSCVREFVGHGIGKSMHEDPKVPNVVTDDLRKKGQDFTLTPGMTLAVEPMVIQGHYEVVTLTDGWTIVTKDHTPACHYEHTIAVTSTGCEVLTDGQ
jgi:methionyl aminopeptidase